MHRFFIKYSFCLYPVILALAAGFFLFFWFTGWASGNRELVVQTARQPASLDPVQMGNSVEKLVDGALYQSLTVYNPLQNRAEGVLAGSWETAQDGRVYLFHLRKATFHDGSPVTAGDVKYSWERALDPKISHYGYLLQNVIGADEVLQGRSKTAAGLKVIDRLTLRVTLNEPDWTFPAVVSSPALAVLSAKVVKREGARYGRPGSRVVGSGPFRLQKWGKDFLILERHKCCATGVAHLQRLRFQVVADHDLAVRQLCLGKIDVLAEVPPQLVEDGNRLKSCCRVYRCPVLAVYYLGFNMDQLPCGNNLELRKGIDFAIDKEAFTRQLLGCGGKPLTGFLPPEFLPEEQVPVGSIPFNREDAVRCLSKAGYFLGTGLSPLTYVYNDSPGHEALAGLLQEELARVGVQLELRKVPWDRYRSEVRSGGVQLFRYGWEADYPEPGNLLYSSFASGEKAWNNLTGYCNSDFDRLLREARGEPNPARRAEIYDQANQMVIADLPVIPLFQKVATFYLRKSIRDFRSDLLGRVDFARVRKVPARR